ncbi:MAG: hypothetical protein ACI9JN_000174 [Bacteroidia bacterium]|jgi:hypothetical protein
MKRVYSYLLVAGFMLGSMELFAQNRYIDEVFTDADVEVTSDITYATNIDFLRSSRLSSASITQIGMELFSIKTALAMGQQIPATHFNLGDTTTVIKVQDVKMDVYAPKASSDTVVKRPVIIFLHTGNFLPSPLNGSPVGTMRDSSAIVLCQGWAKRGYVAISADYRLGWNPLASGPTGEFERRGTLLNAVYRSIQDIKQCVAGLRVDAAAGNTYGIDPDKIVLYGEGTGAYIALAYNSLDKYSEISLPQFLNPLTQKSFIDTTVVGRIDGSGIGASLTLYGPPRASMDISAAVAAGGALADTSWLEAGDKPIIALQCIRDPFAPFNAGTVIVPTTQEDVVDVTGANTYILKAMALGLNDVFKDMPDDPYTKAARSKYGKTFDYIYPSPRDKITVNENLEGLFAVDVAAGASVFQNQAGPWQWWDPESPAAKTVVAAPNVTAHMASLQSNPDMSPAKGRAYVDTIQGYVCPRLAVTLGYYTTTELSAPSLSQLLGTAYPNPTTGVVYVDMKNNTIINSISVVDISGKSVYSTTDINASNATLDLSALLGGYYFLQVDTDLGLATQKVVLTR